MVVRHFMTKKVFTLHPEKTVLEAFQELKKRSIRRAPVLERGKVIGIVSESDLVYVLPGMAAQALTQAGRKSMDIPVRDVMSTPVKTIGPDHSLASAAYPPTAFSGFLIRPMTSSAFCKEIMEIKAVPDHAQYERVWQTYVITLNGEYAMKD